MNLCIHIFLYVYTCIWYVIINSYRQKKDWPLRNKSSNFYNDPGSPTMLKPVQFGEKGTSAFSIKFSKNQKAKSDEEGRGMLDNCIKLSI